MRSYEPEMPESAVYRATPFYHLVELAAVTIEGTIVVSAALLIYVFIT